MVNIMNVLCLIGTFFLIIFSYIIFSKPDVSQTSETAKPVQSQEQSSSMDPNLKDSNTKETIKIDYRENFKSNVKTILSKAFFMQKDRQSAQEVMTECVKELYAIIKTAHVNSPDYILAYRSIISFLENLKEKEVYETYLKMIDTTREIELISDAFAWLASCMANSRQNGFDKNSILESAKQKNIFDYVRLIVNRNIFPHLYKNQREFLLPIIDLCENTLAISNLGNERGPDDGPDLYTDSMHMNFNDIRTFNKKMNDFMEYPEGIADRIERDNDIILAANIEKLNEYMKNIYSMKVVINKTLTINPTQTMVHELTQLASNVINKIRYEQKRREMNNKS